jgi:hypothetical protein
LRVPKSIGAAIGGSVAANGGDSPSLCFLAMTAVFRGRFRAEIRPVSGQS